MGDVGTANTLKKSCNIPKMKDIWQFCIWYHLKNVWQIAHTKCKETFFAFVKALSFHKVRIFSNYNGLFTHPISLLEFANFCSLSSPQKNSSTSHALKTGMNMNTESLQPKATYPQGSKYKSKNHEKMASLNFAFVIGIKTTFLR